MKKTNNIRADLERKQKILDEFNGLSIVVGVQAEKGKNTFGDEVSGLDKYPKPKKAHPESNSRQMTILDIALIHEKGCKIEVTDHMRNWSFFEGQGGEVRRIGKDTDIIVIPERAWFRKAREDTIQRVFDFMSANIYRVISTYELTPYQFMEAVGAFAVDQIVGTMGQVQPPKKDQRRNPRTLMQSGLLQEHITYRVVKK